VSTNDGQHWSYSYDAKLTFMTFPKILKVHPWVVPNNMHSVV